MKLAIASLSLTLLLANASTTMPYMENDQLKSRAEQTNYEETSRYEDVMRFIGELQKRTDKLRVESFGKTEEGRDLPLMIFADPPIAQPREARDSGKPVVFIQANIHAGEVEGKEASLHLARRIATGDLRLLLNNLIILIAPIYNADGNEKISSNNRDAPNGPSAIWNEAFGGPHSGGITAVMADGSVHFVAFGIDPTVWAAVGSRSGGENVQLPF